MGKLLSSTISPSDVPEELVLFARQRGCSIEAALEAWSVINDGAAKYRRKPVGVEEFVESPHYLNAKGLVYPPVMEELIEMNSGEYTEVIFTGSIGSAKTTGAVYSQAYQLYLLSCLRSPHAEFRLDPSSEIVIVVQSLNLAKAREVGYDRLRNMIDASPYFRKYFPYNTEKTSQMEFPNRVIVKPVAGHDTATIGENVIGGLLDEVNYMSVIEKSKKSIDGEQYDQAQANYNSIALRRKNRFMMHGKQPGLLCLVSSRRYPGQFTDRKEEERNKEIAETGKSTIYMYDKRSWDIHEEGKFGDDWFRVFAGDSSRQPRILDDDEELPPEDELLVVDVPCAFKENFERDINQALRDVAGVSTLAKHPFIPNTKRVAACFGHHNSILSLNDTDLKTTKPLIYPKRFKLPKIPRAVHIDLAVTGDSAGIACGCVPGFETIGRGEDVEKLHKLFFDFTLRVRPPKGGEIIFEKIRTLIYLLRQHGLNIQWITFDSFQSVDSMQILRSKGFQVHKQSVDVDILPYNLLKGAFLDDRVRSPMDKHVLKELASLEMDMTKGKEGRVDHPPNGSKDVADAMAGVAYNLCMRREVYAMHNVDPREFPKQVRQIMVKANTRDVESNARIDRSQAKGGVAYVRD